jgi:hypothetical protein
LLGDGGGNTVRQTLSSAGFLEVAVDGLLHSSDPAAAAFDPALAGATATTLAGIRFNGSGPDTLILGSQQLAGGLTVVSGANLTVDGVVHGSAITLAGSEWVMVEAGGLLDAGRIDVAAAAFVNSGQLRADGLTGGAISVRADNILNAGPISADGSSGGGMVRIAFTGSYVGTVAAVTSADGGGGSGGSVTLDGGAAGHLFSSGRHHATGAVGGTVELFGRDIELVGASVDASGANGGGTVRIGGDFHGSNVAQVLNQPHVNAQTVFVAAGTTIRADALGRGDGGRVAVWADGDTTFGGAVSARGGPAGGDGGFIEVSGAGNLDYGGTADTGAPAGNAGTLLLDPKNLVIDAAAGVLPQYSFMDPHPTAGGHFGQSVTVLSGGNVVVTNPSDNLGGTNAGAVYLFDGLTGILNSALVGSNAGDQVGSSITALSNGNYVVTSPNWHFNLGAATWGSGTVGVTGAVSAANSLVGSSQFDLTWLTVTALSNGNYVVAGPLWNGGRGAATWGSGTAGVTGTISAANSLTGSNANDYVGGSSSPGLGGITALSNGNYVVASPTWSGSLGAVTWGNGTAGVTGTVSAANSLIGSSANDSVGNGAVTALSNGNYVVTSPSWNGNRGAATWGSGTAGITGAVSAVNSLTGSSANDYVGAPAGVIVLSNGNYVVSSSYWNGNRGAATWGSGTAGVVGAVSAINSLVGGNANDLVGHYWSATIEVTGKVYGA